MSVEVLGRALEDMLKAERGLRALAEVQNRELRTVLRDLAYRLAGDQIETIRHRDPLAPDNWSPARWAEFFSTGLQMRPSGWSSPEVLVEQLRQAQQALGLMESERRILRDRVEAASSQVGRKRAGDADSGETTLPAPPDPAASAMDFPEMPPKPPVRYAARLGTGTRWRREAMVLYLMAALGRSVRLEILSAVGEVERVGGRSGSMRRVFSNGLVPGGFVEESVLAMSLSHGQTRLAVVRLTERGQELSRFLGWEPVESEWGRLLRLHQGEVQEAHTAAVLTFAYHARRRGWQALVVPAVEGPAQPDSLVQRENEKAYVEVELGNRKPDKWRNLSALQGFVALCAATELRRAQLVAECKHDCLPGRATDIETLIQNSGGAVNGKLWQDEWQAA